MNSKLTYGEMMIRRGYVKYLAEHQLPRTKLNTPPRLIRRGYVKYLAEHQLPRTKPFLATAPPTPPPHALPTVNVTIQNATLLAVRPAVSSVTLSLALQLEWLDSVREAYQGGKGRARERLSARREGDGEIGREVSGSIRKREGEVFCPFSELRWRGILMIDSVNFWQLHPSSANTLMIPCSNASSKTSTDP